MYKQVLLKSTYTEETNYNKNKCHKPIKAVLAHWLHVAPSLSMWKRLTDGSAKCSNNHNK